MTSNDFECQRLRDIEDNLAQERDLLKQFEDAWRYETDPRIQARCQRDIARQKKTIAQYQQEYQQLEDKLSMDSSLQANDVSPENSFSKPNTPQQSININGNINQSSNSDKMVQSNSNIEIKIFLASSSELQEEREKFEIFIYRKCREYRNEGIFLDLIIWEDFIDAISQTRLQDEYNKAIAECDIFVSLFFTKVGKYTEEEFLKAWETFSANGKPLIYTYIKDASIQTGAIREDDIMSLFSFKKKLGEAGHYPTKYTGIDNLQNHFGGQLTKILPKLIEVKKKSN